MLQFQVDSVSSVTRALANTSALRRWRDLCVSATRTTSCRRTDRRAFVRKCEYIGCERLSSDNSGVSRRQAAGGAGLDVRGLLRGEQHSARHSVADVGQTKRQHHQVVHPDLSQPRIRLRRSAGQKLHPKLPKTLFLFRYTYVSFANRQEASAGVARVSGAPTTRLTPVTCRALVPRAPFAVANQRTVYIECTEVKRSTLLYV